MSTVPYTLTRLGTVMTPEPSEPYEREGVLNPAAGRTPDGRLHLLPRLVAEGNMSRVGLAEVMLDGGIPVGVRRRGVVLAPDEGWERGKTSSGVEDPRITWVPRLGRHVMTYVALGPLGPRPALAVSEDLVHWQRLGPMHFAYQSDLNTDLNLFPNKDVVLFPEPVAAPDGTPSYAFLHRPMWDLSWIRDGEGTHLPANVTDERPGIWASFAAAEAVDRELAALVALRQHRLVALPAYDYESLKIGAGPPPIRVDEGWLLIHHGVSGELTSGWEPQTKVRYAAGAMLLNPDDVTQVLARTPQPLLVPETPEERLGTVDNVVFPTAMEEVGGKRYAFYGMADRCIGVARLNGPNEVA
jgi:predicted GH43/DUF377 family glycosyl hydrolase